MQNFAALTKTHAFTSTALAKIDRRARIEVLADRRTAARARAALLDAQRADRELVPLAFGEMTGSETRDHSLALPLQSIAADEVAYWKVLEQEALLYERISGVIKAVAAGEREWARRAQAGDFPTRSAALSALSRAVYKPLAPGLLLLHHDDVLRKRGRHAEHALRKDLYTLNFGLNLDSDLRGFVRRLMHADPKGFLVMSIKHSN